MTVAQGVQDVEQESEEEREKKRKKKDTGGKSAQKERKEMKLIHKIMCGCWKVGIPFCVFSEAIPSIFNTLILFSPHFRIQQVQLQASLYQHLPLCVEDAGI